MCEKYETKDRHTTEDIRANLTKAIEQFTFVRANVDLISDTSEREACFEASNELVAIGASMQEGMLRYVGRQVTGKPAPVTERSSSPVTDAPQSVARPRG
jgi:hypothetical protein